MSDIDTREPQLRQASPGGASTCFEAKAASVYTVSTMVQDWRLWTRVFDRESGENVDSACVVRTASGVTLARKQEPAERPPTRAPSAADNDNSPMRSWGGFRLGVGYSSGGADLLNGDGGEPLPAGAGSYITFGGTVIPVWIGDVVGLGAGGSFGLKRNGASDGIGLSRSPAELWFEALLRVSPRLFVELAGGMHKDLNISMEWSGSNQEWQSSWGRVFDLGLYTISSKHVAWGFGIRRVDLEYKRYGTTFDAGSMGLEFRLHINP